MPIRITFGLLKNENEESYRFCVIWQRSKNLYFIGYILITVNDLLDHHFCNNIKRLWKPYLNRCTLRFANTLRNHGIGILFVGLWILYCSKETMPLAKCSKGYKFCKVWRKVLPLRSTSFVFHLGNYEVRIFNARLANQQLMNQVINL